ncbi:methyl-accepting chemotaxis protein [Neorhizobium sp. LjRoot104]|uniref:methyl-accepting chemotaxis protein n=1 Tax=Neorhizobium sp. LjRoot104 TaxID=3342254 RepID=UPI003ED0DDA1
MNNISIIGKFFAIMALFGVFALGAAGYAGMQIKAIDASYGKLLGGEAAASTYIARANRAMQNSRAAIGDLLMMRSAEQNAAATRELEAATRSFVQFMDQAAERMPANAQIPSLKAEGLKILTESCARSVKLANTATATEEVLASQLVFLNECQPQFVIMSPKMTQAVTDMDNLRDVRSDVLTDKSNSTALITIFGMIVGMIVVLSVGFASIRKWLVAPIRRLASIMELLANGDLSPQVLGAERRDEVGAMVKAVVVFKENGLRAKALEDEAVQSRNLSETERQRVAAADRKRAEEMAAATNGLAEGLKQLSSGNLGFELNSPFAPDFEGLRSDFNSAVARLRDTLVQVANSTSGIDSGSRELSISANDLSKRTEQQAAALEETAAALDQITTNVSQSSQRTEEARTVANEARQAADRSGDVVSNAVGAMQRIETSSRQISNIIGVIDEIAFQTNLLALNAGVEAARAGEAGKGFAVVAQEVRELAQRSAQAAKEIKELIRTSAAEVEGGVKLVSDTGDALKVIGNYVISINGQLDAIATSAKEQSIGLAEVNTAVNQMDQVTQQNAAMVEEATAASSALASEASKLRELVAMFDLKGSIRSPFTPAVAQPDHKPVPSAARRLMGRVATAVGGRANGAAASADWQDF